MHPEQSQTGPTLQGFGTEPTGSGQLVPLLTARSVAMRRTRLPRIVPARLRPAGRRRIRCLVFFSWLVFVLVVSLSTYGEAAVFWLFRKRMLFIKIPEFPRAAAAFRHTGLIGSGVPRNNSTPPASPRGAIRPSLLSWQPLNSPRGSSSDLSKIRRQRKLNGRTSLSSCKSLVGSRLH